MRYFRRHKPITFLAVAIALITTISSTAASASVPDTNSYWKNFSSMEKLAKKHLDGAMQTCRGRSGADAEAILNVWNASTQAKSYPGSEFNPCNGSGTLVVGQTSVVASNGRAIKLSYRDHLHTEWDFRARTVKLWYSGDLISLSVSPISVSILNASLGSFGSHGQSGPATTSINESQIISGLEAFWRSVHDHYPTHSMYDIAQQVITGKDEGREMLLDFIHCGKSICE